MAGAATLEDPSLSLPAHLLMQHERTEPMSCAVAAGKAVLFSARSPDKLTSNEDSAAVIPVDETSGVLVVADGLGGERAGQDASSLAVRTLVDAVRSAPQEGDVNRLRPAILDGIETANRLILEMGVGAATTIAVVEILDGHVRPYHVGDSMILVVGGRGKVKLLTISHAPVAMAVEAGLIDEVEAMHHDERHLVSNVVGSTDMRIEIGTRIKLAPQDTVVLASDGLTDNLHLSEIIERIRKGKLMKSMDALVAAADERMQTLQPGHPHKPDDLTVIAYRRSRAKRQSKA
ncbi:MAG: serine/threonine-protein phosphatase [Planctomycetaceae bacterium]|nr:serine/threonine-protein phosphatase [Planctomycetaceae bacterium]